MQSQIFLVDFISKTLLEKIKYSFLIIFIKTIKWEKSTLNTAEDEDTEVQLWGLKSHLSLLSPTSKSTANQPMEWHPRLKSSGLKASTRSSFGQREKPIPKTTTTKSSNFCNNEIDLSEMKFMQLNDSDL